MGINANRAGLDTVAMQVDPGHKDLVPARYAWYFTQ